MYLGHLSLQSGKPLILCEESKNFLTAKNIYTSKHVVIDYDETKVNTCHKECVIHFLEEN